MSSINITESDTTLIHDVIIAVVPARRAEAPRIIATAVAAAAPEQLSLNLGGPWD